MGDLDPFSSQAVGGPLLQDYMCMHTYLSPTRNLVPLTVSSVLDSLMPLYQSGFMHWSMQLAHTSSVLYHATKKQQPYIGIS